MSRYDYNYSCTGCGTGSSCTFEVLIDGASAVRGTIQISCDSDRQATIIAQRPYGAGDAAYANGTLITGGGGTPPGTTTDYLLVGAVLVLSYLLWRKI